MRANPEAQAAEIVAEVDQIKFEIQQLVSKVKGKQPTAAQLRRARELGRRCKALDAAAARLVLEDACTWTAVGERLGRQARDGDDVTDEDARRAAQIATGFDLKAGLC